MAAMSQDELLPQTLASLEWDRLLGILAGHVRSTMGAERCRQLPLETDLGQAERRQQETSEMAALRASEDPFPALAFPDLREVLGRASKGAALETQELRDLGLVLDLALDVARYLEARREAAPALRDMAAPIEGWQVLRVLRADIARCVDPEGNIRESATPELRRLSQQSQDLKRQIRHRLDVILASTRYADLLQERYFDQREGRYVVPIKADLRGGVPGIVHDVSGSGATVFLEPRELVELNNAIKVAELEVQREVRRILQELSADVAAQAPLLLAGLDALAALDCVAARAALGQVMRAGPVALNDQGRIMLRQARHPLLVLARERVVANDIMLDESVRTLVISGPNTGGKTVTLKIVGLFALMARAGLPLPCEPGSDMALFQEVYADIGDAQDLTRDLSSFSAHMTQMVRLLAQAPDPAPSPAGAPSKALVLLDEPVTSTDPAEGAALAEALLLHLADRGMKVVATTHYNSLKALAQTAPGFVNASVEFDVSRLAPTYRLIRDLPGGSSAIDIAGRLGLDARILDRALQLLRREDRVLEQMLGDLQDKQRQLSEELAEARRLRVEAEQAAREAAEVAARLQSGEKEVRRKLRQKLTEDLLQARAQVQGILEGLKGERTVADARAAKQRLAEVGAQARAGLAAPMETVPIEQVKPGGPVEIVSLGKVGVLLEDAANKKRVRVRLGESEVSVEVAGLVGLAGGVPAPPPAGSRGAGRPQLTAAGGMDTSAVVDVRGQAADEALEQVIAALDRAALEAVVFLRIIHGHGTGRLKAVLRDYLRGSPYVASFRGGERGEGGDGVTIVALK